jgi:hypothetical protein
MQKHLETKASLESSAIMIFYRLDGIVRIRSLGLHHDLVIRLSGLWTCLEEMSLQTLKI